MENASKALIITGEVLIGILVLTLLSFIIVQFGNFSRNLNTQMSETEINRFNVEFTNFSGRADISMQEVASIINFAQKNNQEFEAQNGDAFFVDVKIDGESVIGNSINEYLTNTKNSKYYYCNIVISNINIDNTNNTITFKRNFIDSDITYDNRTNRVSSIQFHTIDNDDYANAILQQYTINVTT